MFPAKTIRAAVADLGDDWQASRHLSQRPFVPTCADNGVMARAHEQYRRMPRRRHLLLATQGLPLTEYFEIWLEMYRGRVSA